MKTTPKDLPKQWQMRCTFINKASLKERLQKRHSKRKGTTDTRSTMEQCPQKGKKNNNKEQQHRRQCNNEQHDTHNNEQLTLEK
mmetsp:Transcript_32682/g.45588  ORF Transcript_32682/g.45588 Transcript_32682/m.45588 type:complete len:84 (-) Transcript_32682:25-276(-)